VAEKLFRESLIAILPKNFSILAPDGVISLPALQDVPIVMGTSAICPNLRQALDRRCADLGIELNVAHEVHNIFEALALILSGCGIGLCGGSLASLMPANLAIRQFDSTAPQLDIAVAYRKGPVSKNLRKLLRISHEVGLDMSAAFTVISGAA
jgi:DNA-binding transcriptional LysR family regulator